MTKYQTLINILDTIVKEAPASMNKKYPKTNDLEKQNQSRARAFIHLYLKVNFGMLDFKEREHFITDGSYDGGIDGYYIHTETKQYFLFNLSSVLTIRILKVNKLILLKFS